MSFDKKNAQGEFDTIENGLEELSIKIISILKDYREKGLIGEEEYKKNVKLKESFLNYLNEKKASSNY